MTLVRLLAPLHLKVLETDEHVVLHGIFKLFFAEVIARLALAGGELLSVLICKFNEFE